MTVEQYVSNDRRVFSGKSLPVILTIIVSIAVSFILMICIRNDYEYHNGDSSFTEYTFMDNSVTVSFVPRFDEVKGISIGLVSVGSDTGFTAKIYDSVNDQVSEIHFEYDGSDGFFSKVCDDIKLTHGRTYTISLIPDDPDDIMYVTTERNYRTSEVGTVSVNGVDSGCYPLFKIAYRGGLDTAGRKLIYLLSFQALILMVTSTVMVFIRRKNIEK